MNKLTIFFIGLLATGYNLQPGEIAELLKKSDDSITEDAVKEAIEQSKADNSFNEILDKDKTRVSNLRKTSFDDGEKKARKEVLSNFEKELREKYGIEGDLKGADLVQAIHDLNRNSNGDDKKISEDDIKKHKLYIDLQESVDARLKDRDKEWETKIEAKEKEYSKQQTFSTIKDAALTHFATLNPMLSDDAERAANQKSLLVNALSGYDWEIQDGGRKVAMKDGKVLEDAHGNRVTFEDLVKTEASKYFDFKAATDRKSPGNESTDKKKYTGAVPKTAEEYTKVVNDPNLSYEDRKAIIDATPEDIKFG